MNESEFVGSFIRRDRRERLLHELNDPKKRYKALDRFSHDSENLLDPKKIVLSSHDLSKEKDFPKYIKDHNEDLTILSTDPYINGIQAVLQDALQYARMSTEAAIVLGEGIAIVKTEAMKKDTMEYLLLERKPYDHD